MSCISYITGGRLGDFFQQLSVVYEYYLKTGRKGIIYLDDALGDKFRFGAAQALEDIREIIALQPYNFLVCRLHVVAVNKVEKGIALDVRQ